VIKVCFTLEIILTTTTTTTTTTTAMNSSKCAVHDSLPASERNGYRSLHTFRGLQCNVIFGAQYTTLFAFRQTKHTYIHNTMQCS